MQLHYHLLNVFTRDGERLSGNPLCVFEDGSRLDTPTMQALALQFNLSETTFLLPSERASARVRIFTPDFEMRFAGHPTLGTAHVVRALGRGGDRLTLEMPAGLIPVEARGDRWTLGAQTARWREVEVTPAALAAALGLEAQDLRCKPDGERPLWVDSGSEQLLVPLASAAAVERAAPRAEGLALLRSAEGRRMAYLFADAAGQDRAQSQVVARFLFEAGGAMREDPATGSACANLGGWYHATRSAALPLRREIRQGDLIRRPSTLHLSVGAGGEVGVAGDVVRLGSGSIGL